jgi:hypothetical protein
MGLFQQPVRKADAALYNNEYRYGNVFAEFRSARSRSMVGTSIRSVMASSFRVSCIAAVVLNRVDLFRTRRRVPVVVVPELPEV